MLAALVLPLSLPLPLLLSASSARAQWGGSIAATTDERFRGVSLNDERPDLRFTLAWDHASGVYAGASASGLRFDHGPQRLGLLGYLGIAWPLRDGLQAEVGLTETLALHEKRYDDAEVYTGLVAERWALRLSYAPDYFGSGLRTAYVDGSVTQPLPIDARLTLRAFAHLGLLQPLADHGPAQLDASLGAALRPDPSRCHCELRLAWVWAQRADRYIGAYTQRRETLVLSLSSEF